MEKQSKRSLEQKQPNFISGFLWGVMFGGLGMFLFGTKSGKRIKKFLMEHGEQLLDEIEQAYQKSNLNQTVIKKLLSVKPKKQTKKTDEKKQKKQESKKSSDSTDQQEM